MLAWPFCKLRRVHQLLGKLFPWVIELLWGVLANMFGVRSYKAGGEITIRRTCRSLFALELSRERHWSCRHPQDASSGPHRGLPEQWSCWNTKSQNCRILGVQQSYSVLWFAQFVFANLGLFYAGREAIDQEALTLRMLRHRFQQQVCHLLLRESFFETSNKSFIGWFELGKPHTLLHHTQMSDEIGLIYKVTHFCVRNSVGWEWQMSYEIGLSEVTHFHAKCEKVR